MFQSKASVRILAGLMPAPVTPLALKGYAPASQVQFDSVRIENDHLHYAEGSESKVGYLKTPCPLCRHRIYTTRM